MHGIRQLRQIECFRFTQTSPIVNYPIDLYPDLDISRHDLRLPESFNCSVNVNTGKVLYRVSVSIEASMSKFKFHAEDLPFVHVLRSYGTYLQRTMVKKRECS